MSSREDIDKFISDAFNIKPDQLGTVKVLNKVSGLHEDKQIYRSFETYGKVPEFDPSIKKSYMYSTAKDIPAIFQEHLEDIQKRYGQTYNQMLVNWYEPWDFIEPHRDCTNFLKEGSIIRVKFWASEPRILRFTSVSDGYSNDRILEGIDEYKIPPKINQEYRHEILPGGGRYLSLTFREIR